MKIDRLYYTVEQLAEHWLISIDDILQYGFTNQLTFLTQADWEYPRTKLILRGQHTGIAAQELANIYFAKEPFSDPGNAGETANGILKGEECIITYHPGLDRLIIDVDEVKRFEREHPELSKTDNNQKTNEKDVLVFFKGRGAWFINNPDDNKYGAKSAFNFTFRDPDTGEVELTNRFFELHDGVDQAYCDEYTGVFKLTKKDAAIHLLSKDIRNLSYVEKITTTL
ncbi:MAG: hypothetical protein Q8Q50_02235 [Methylobacter sp.]|nr:hypothetical protein [Methylobacter sp.]